MNIPDIRNANLEQKRVLARVDFNVEFSSRGEPKEKYRIGAVKKTIDFILSKKGIKLALLSHLGRPGGKDKIYSFEPAVGAISKILGRRLVFAEDCAGDKVKEKLGKLEAGEILMLENVRFHKEEVENSGDFAEKLAENFDIYVNEAFSVTHRAQASIAKIVEFLPSFAGINFLEEIIALSNIRRGLEGPAVAIIGGIKIETKLPVINFFAENYDQILLGGRIGLEAENRKLNFPANVILPKDYLEQGFDIGPLAIKQFSEFIKNAKTIVWNGPLGQFEREEFFVGTKEIVKAIVKNKAAYKVAGGGETIQVLEKLDLIKNFDFVSTGGGAMLEFLAKGTLPALKALENQKLNLKSQK
ncbi:phosphoglycerate kinase [Patescibacteria group bacterium]|nr:phosphoglycerate kinase [Patescibacteria group bacterium]